MSDAELPPISVYGGVGGERAVTEDLERGAAVLHRAAQELREAGKALRVAGWNAEDAYPRALPEVAPYVYDAKEAAWDALQGANGATALERELEDVGSRLSQVAATFLAAESAANHRVGLVEGQWRAARDLAATGVAVQRAGAAAVWGLTPLGQALRKAGADPIGEALAPDQLPPTTGFLNRTTAGALVAGHDAPRGPLPSQYEAAVAAATAAAAALERWVGEPRIDGAAARPGGGHTRDRPRGLEDLVDGLADIPYGDHGAVAIDTLTRADGTRAHILSIPGTRDFTLWNASPFDWVSNGQAVVGQTSDTARLAAAAMAEHGIDPGEPVMVVGHSQGGIVAVNLTDSPATDQYDITHAVPVGAPTNRNLYADGVSYLEMGSYQDVVSELDGRTAAEAPNVLAVMADLETAGDPALAAASTTLMSAHSLSSYSAIGRAADASDRAALKAWRASASEFLGEGTMHRTEYTPTIAEPPAKEPMRLPPPPQPNWEPVDPMAQLRQGNASPGGIPGLRP